MTENNIESHGPTHLGRATLYVDRYDSALLDPIPRALARNSLPLGVEGGLPFTGVDIWTAFEISWLNLQGKPIVAMAEFEFGANSPAIVESKSFKLYLNSFNQSQFSDWSSVTQRLSTDLALVSGLEVKVRLMSLAEGAGLSVQPLDGDSIDDLDVTCNVYQPDAGILQLREAEGSVSETLCSDLLKSNCPVTGQPDWASLYIRYQGRAIDRASLLKYIVSYRHHRDFHEHCVETIFVDILTRCKPTALTVYARYTRRGGLDINPFRTNCGERPNSLRLVRQ